MKVGAEADYGVLRYSSAGSGVATGVPDTRMEGTIVAGMDFFPGAGLAVSPYIGLGIRQLSNDTRGTSSFGAFGDRRTSQYLYLPIGVSAQVKANNGWTVVPNLQFNYLVKGTQTSYLTDINFPGINDAKNTQKAGYGIRAALMFEKAGWSFGPTLQWWDIGDSDVVTIFKSGNFVVGAVEPKNTTLQLGFRVGRRF